jgi:CRP/FNR family transcriptional regulator, cyclic AMP receptor protein
VSTDLVALLRGTDLLGSAPAQDLQALAAASRMRTYRRGQVVFTAGDRGDTVIMVVSGLVKVVVRSADGGELTLAVIQPGGILGDVVAADGGPRSADAQTMEETRLLLIPREMVEDLSGRVPSVAQALTRSVAASLRRLTEAASDLVFLDLPRRVAKLLLSQPRGPDGIIRLKMSQEELARQAGGTRQSINAALRGFDKRGWIEVRDRAVTVIREAALAQFAGN